ncbi:hypothetical protein O1V64_10940 [Rouxiella badensis]|nr:hypothetical protein O1V64_10940 [Rouxiella badensis]
MSKVTFVVEYQDGEEPVINAGTQILGGRICSVAFFDYKDDHLAEAELSAVENSLNEADCFKELCGELGVNSEEILEKLRMQV